MTAYILSAGTVSRNVSDLRSVTMDRQNIEVRDIGSTGGTADTLAACLAGDGAKTGDLVLYGDVLLTGDDLAQLKGHAWGCII
jgi:hypothetical protein